MTEPVEVTQDDRLTNLKKRADILGIPYSNNIGADTLAAKIDAALLAEPVTAVDEAKQRVRNNTLVAEYAQIVKEVAHEYHFRYANLAQAMRDTGDLSEICQGVKNDGLHFGDRGYEILGKLIAENLKQM